MKVVILLTMNAFLLVGACGDRPIKMETIEKVSLQERLEKSPEVHAARRLFTKYSRTLANIEPTVLLRIHAQIKAAGHNAETSDMEDLEKYLETSPQKEVFIECIKNLKAYQSSLLAVQRRFPELASDPNLIALVVQLEENPLRSYQSFPHQIVQMHNADITTTIHHQ